MTRVLLADPDATRRAAMATLLAADKELDLLEPVGGGVGLVQAASRCDVVLLVSALTERTVAAVAEARASTSPRAVLLAGAVTDEPVAQAVSVGCDGCLDVTSSPLQIGVAVRAAARGEQTDGSMTGPLLQRARREPELSEREMAVLRLVAADLSNKEIADTLYLSVSSVKSHLSHAFGRLGVNHREAAVAEARRQGLLAPGSGQGEAAEDPGGG